ncbi:MAG: TVP38/TMEM64 family protein [Clostridia bacterium]|nr:TVP38/TMEM64 family protein [Clostridia bacterium]
MSSKNSKIIKILILIVVILLLVILSIELLPLFKNMTTPEGRQEIKYSLENMGLRGVFALIGLMIAQVLVAFLPGEPVELVAGMCYGPIWGTVLVIIGAFLSTILIFFSVRKFGRSFIYTFTSKEKIEKLEKSKWFKNPKKLELIFLILFLLPGTPKDLLVYIGGVLPVNSVRFIIISTVARIPAILALTVLGHGVIEYIINI